MREGVNKVALRLFEHNEKAYHAAVRMMDQYGKAAIVHPTGTGKSYIAFKLIEDNPEKVVIWLSPSEYIIFKTQLESLKRNDPDFPLANVHFYTYAKLMCCTQAQLDEIAVQKPAYIILDEFHRAGAECWGESTVALLKLCPDAKLLTRTIRSEEITIDVRICAALATNRGGEVYLAAIAPDMELTVITLDEAPDILPCFEEDDACLNLPNTSLLLCYNPAQVLKMGGKHYLTGPVILVRTNMDGEVISLTIDEVYLFQKYLASHSITLMADDQKLPCICID